MKAFTAIPLILLLFEWQSTAAQRHLRITSTVKEATWRVYEGERVGYRLRNRLLFRKGVVSAIGDTALVLKDMISVRYDRVAILRLEKNVHLISTFQKVFFRGAVLFVVLNTVNNLITDRSPVFDLRAVYVSGGLLAASWLVKRLDYKRIRIGRNKVLKVIESTGPVPGKTEPAVRDTSISGE
jgi:hypothetical protein